MPQTVYRAVYAVARIPGANLSGRTSSSNSKKGMCVLHETDDDHVDVSARIVIRSFGLDCGAPTYASHFRHTSAPLMAALSYRTLTRV